MHCLISESSSSSADASSSLQVIIALGVANTATKLNSFAYGECLLTPSSLLTNLDHESAMFFGPGGYFTLNLNV